MRLLLACAALPMGGARLLAQTPSGTTKHFPKPDRIRYDGMQACARPMLRHLVIPPLMSLSANTADAPLTESPQRHSWLLGIPALLGEFE